MTFTSLKGYKKKLVRSEKYLIDWNGKSRSKFQQRVKELIYPLWCADVVFEEMPVVGTRLTLDFYNANKKIAVEVDGNHHYAYNKFFHKDRNDFLLQLDRDDKKEIFCERNDILLVRIMESDKLTLELLNNLGIE